MIPFHIAKCMFFEVLVVFVVDGPSGYKGINDIVQNTE